MKNFISKNWRNFFIIIGTFFIIIDLIYIVITPATVTQDFLEYGPSGESTQLGNITSSDNEEEENDIKVSGDNFGDVSGEKNDDAPGVIDHLSEKTGLEPNLVKGLLILGVLVLVVLIISNFTDGENGGGKKS